MTGWIRVDRGILDHPLFKSEPAKLGAWVWLISKAAWRPTRIDLAGKVIAIERGQFCISQRAMAHELGWSLRTTQRFLQRLESLSMIRLETASGRSLITVCNYAKYQDVLDKPASEARQKRVTKEQDNKGTRDYLERGSLSPARVRDVDRNDDRQDPPLDRRSPSSLEIQSFNEALPAGSTPRALIPIESETGHVEHRQPSRDKLRARFAQFKNPTARAAALYALDG